MEVVSKALPLLQEIKPIPYTDGFEHRSLGVVFFKAAEIVGGFFAVDHGAGVFGFDARHIVVAELTFGQAFAVDAESTKKVKIRVQRARLWVTPERGYPYN